MEIRVSNEVRLLLDGRTLTMRHQNGVGIGAVLTEEHAIDLIMALSGTFPAHGSQPSGALL